MKVITIKYGLRAYTKHEKLQLLLDKKEKKKRNPSDLYSL